MQFFSLPNNNNNNRNDAQTVLIMHFSNVCVSNDIFLWLFVKPYATSEIGIWIVQAGGIEVRSMNICI
jgi:hypothetical protein